MQKLKALLRAEHEGRSGKCVGEHGRMTDDGYRLAAVGWLAGPRIEKMMVTDALVFKKALVISGSNDSGILYLDCRQKRIGLARMLNTNSPRPS